MPVGSSRKIRYYGKFGIEDLFLCFYQQTLMHTSSTLLLLIVTMPVKNITKFELLNYVLYGKTCKGNTILFAFLEVVVPKVNLYSR